MFLSEMTDKLFYIILLFRFSYTLQILIQSVYILTISKTKSEPAGMSVQIISSPAETIYWLSWSQRSIYIIYP
jgi:hypothetical protein